MLALLLLALLLLALLLLALLHRHLLAAKGLALALASPTASRSSTDHIVQRTVLLAIRFSRPTSHLLLHLSSRLIKFCVCLYSFGNHYTLP